MVEELEHPSAGHIKVVGTPLKLSFTPASIRMPPPILGEHTTDILQSLGYTASEITELIESNVIQS
jgi:crotonobetainyl-CoA:carnitine CoA-transferase CaiB-like acyl-CoA transferase